MSLAVMDRKAVTHSQNDGLGLAQETWLRVVESLDRTGYPPLRKLTLDVDDAGVVTISGQVPNFFLRQLALSAVKDTPGVTCVRDRLRVQNALVTSEPLHSHRLIWLES